MALTRTMADTDENRRIFFRKEIVKNLWLDCDQRLKKLASIPSKVKRNSMRDLFEHFNAALLIYDEGLAKDDQALAGALWRVMLTCDTETLDIRRLRTLVHYVRRNIAYLDNVQYDDLLKENALIWHPLKESIKATEDHI